MFYVVLEKVAVAVYIIVFVAEFVIAMIAAKRNVKMTWSYGIFIFYDSIQGVIISRFVIFFLLLNYEYSATDYRFYFNDMWNLCYMGALVASCVSVGLKILKKENTSA